MIPKISPNVVLSVLSLQEIIALTHFYLLGQISI